ncbi:DUF5312 domain-containing protein [Brucepastera parasyntrophica]|uniref:DUF5312 family protein n=1 Tax=Brucepastera parasyntrophica TaxID=2880008 RepID=UPI00210CF127|nr:DUF5312 family protein [Brucepastera parasyntrophica]ULQ60501.1 DUF5312 domain-containing protein [Brucepastera parasyntrophica]
MAGKMTTFEQLVRTLESAERQDMLRRLADITEVRTEETNIAGPVKKHEGHADSEGKQDLVSEPLLVRIWYFITAFFSSITPEQKYSKHLIRMLGKRLAKTDGQYIDVQKRLYSSAFFQELYTLNKAHGFFCSLMKIFENDEGNFYIVLASLMMKKTTEAIAATADPFVEPYDRETDKDVRAILLRGMNTAFQSVPDEEKNQMQLAAQAIEWLRKFCNFQMNHLLSLFTEIPGYGRGCLIETATEEMKNLAEVLNGAGKVPILLLEALFLFSVQEDAVNERFDMEKECANFIQTAVEQLSAIRQFKLRIPLVDFVRYSSEDLDWHPRSLDKGSEWFKLFKNAWRSRFEEKWAEWNRLYKGTLIRKQICAFLGIQELPSLQYHPWEGLWIPLNLHNELPLLFLKGLFTTVYPSVMMKPLKILMIEGEFYKRENLIEYTEAFNTLEHQKQDIANFESRLSPKGDIGGGFFLAHKDHLATMKAKARLENLMLTTENEAEMIVTRVLTAFHTILAILAGILDYSHTSPYDHLINLSSIQGNMNERYRKDLASVRQLIQDTCNLIQEIQAISLDYR